MEGKARRESKGNEGYAVYGRRWSFIEILIGCYSATDETQMEHRCNEASGPEAGVPSVIIDAFSRIFPP